VDHLERRLAGLPCQADLTPSWLMARVYANHLRELDAFLSVMIEAAARDLGATTLECRRFSQRRNTHYKLRDLLTRIPGRPFAGDHALCATGAVRHCLHVHGGRVRATDRTPLARATRFLGVSVENERLIVPQSVFLSICDLYRLAGMQIIEAISSLEPGQVDLSALHRHVRCANVACDGF
jgi:hypothetical protein